MIITYQKEIIEKVREIKTSLRKNLWDEENRLIAVDLKPDEPTGHPIAIYTYNAAGERVVRYNYDRIDVTSNATEISEVAAANIMIYPNGLLMAKIVKDIKDLRASNLTYTKHYYIGSERISAKIGTSNNLGLYPETLVDAAMPQISHSVVRAPSNQSVLDAGEIVEIVYSKFNQPPPANNPMPDGNSLGIVHDLGKINYFYFHPDHLGSSSYITNKDGIVSQHMEYLPFGETLVDEHLNSYNSPFKYNGKEFDAETGNYYYGARYYDPKWSIFISVDPLAEQTFDSYGYVYNNPINLIDPTGMSAEEIIIIGGKDNNLTYENGKLYRDGSEYTGKVDKFIQKTVEALNIIGGTEEGSSMINELQSSKNEFKIMEGSNEYVASDKYKAFATQFASDPAYLFAFETLSNQGVDFSGGSGGTIFWDLSGGSIPTLKGMKSNRVTNLGHEMFHGLDSNRGLLDDRKESNVTRREWQAVFRENNLREQLGQPLRTHYQTTFDENGIKTSAGPSMLNSSNKNVKPIWYQ